jgi:hypothetical protein
VCLCACSDVASWASAVFAQRDRSAEEDDELKTLTWIMSHTKVRTVRVRVRVSALCALCGDAAIAQDCPRCATAIEKNEGCNHMTCRAANCKHEFWCA